MTRFARAKGSKASNEKKPEEATSWSEMKNALLSKSSKTPEQIVKKEKKVTVDIPNQTEWASLGDDNCLSLLGQNSKKKNKISDIQSTEVEKTKKLKKRKKLKSTLHNTDGEKEVPNSSAKPPKKDKNKPDSVKEGIQLFNVGKTNKKRKLSSVCEDDVDKPPEKKKKKKSKKLERDAVNVNSNEKNKLGKLKNKISQKKEKLKKIKKPNEQNTETNVNKEKKFQSPSKQKNDKQFDRKSNQKYRKNESNIYKNTKYGNRNYNQDSSVVEELIVNGEKILIVKFQGFNVTKDDAERLKKLRNEMIKEGIPKNKLEAAIKLERRRAEKALSRLKKAVCFHCRGFGHLLSNCPVLAENPNTSTGICYKCGSTEHSAMECKVVKGTNFQFAECFICKEQGHIARQCPDNPRGLYPQGGACRECGDVTHLRKDCPQVLSKKPEEIITVGIRSDRNLECLDEEIAIKEKQKEKKPAKKNSIKF